MLAHFHPDDICPRCEVLTTPRSHHCNLCDKCTEGWDHHCPWLDNCVGIKNNNSFFVMLVSLMLYSLINIVPPILDLVLNEVLPPPQLQDDPSSKLYKEIFCINALGCHVVAVWVPIAFLSAITALVMAMIAIWLVVNKFKKFLSDGARISSANDGNSIA